MYRKIEKWLNEIISAELPEEIVALNFNLYQDSDNEWSLELVGTESFDKEDEDWTCDEIFTTRDNTLAWSEEAEWEEILEEIIENLKEYLERGKYADLLKEYQGIGVGFVDGDIEILYFK